MSNGINEYNEINHAFEVAEKAGLKLLIGSHRFQLRSMDYENESLTFNTMAEVDAAIHGYKLGVRCSDSNAHSS